MDENTCAIIVYSENILFPNTSQMVDITGLANISTITKSVANKQKMCIAFIRNKRVDDVEIEDILAIAALVDINKVTRVNRDTIRLAVDILESVELTNITKGENFFSADYTILPEPEPLADDILLTYKAYIMERIKEITSIAKKSLPSFIIETMNNTYKSNEFVNLASNIINDIEQKYELLIETDPMLRIELLATLMEKTRQDLKLVYDIESRVADKLKKINNDYFLREQIKEMEKEIDDGGQNSVCNEYREKLATLKLNEEDNAKVEKEIARLSRMNETVPEHSILRNYLDVVLNLPWGICGEDNQSIDNARDILEEDHYGITEVKDRIIEYLAVRLLTAGKNKGSAICLVGPPGVGKTSVAKSIAKALNKEYVQLTLGGVHDEAEIRGHRKTYIGAMPGRIITALTKAKTNNPVFLLDEVDKITRDMRGDPQAALLEVLDPNQNTQFRDNYIELPYDLSKVMFILTANDLSTIDKPLLDRMEVIEMDGYTVEEKTAIAQKYLIKKQVEEHGLVANQLTMNDDVIREIIEGYTNEAGVRELERKVANICRKIAIKIIKSDKRDTQYTLSIDNIREMLGVRKLSDIELESLSEIGRVCGLAWTATGGTTLHIEVSIIKGSGEFKLTGNLGDVMKESATLAMSIAKQKAINSGIEPDFFKNHDIHIHVPMGAVPKDGPSAGITISTALLSAILKSNIKAGIAMTGEVSLSGRVHAIGGLKGKSLAALRAGIKQIIIPKDNEKDLVELPDSVRRDIEFIMAENIDDVLRHAVVGYGD